MLRFPTLPSFLPSFLGFFKMHKLQLVQPSPIKIIIIIIIVVAIVVIFVWLLAILPLVVFYRCPWESKSFRSPVLFSDFLLILVMLNSFISSFNLLFIELLFPDSWTRFQGPQLRLISLLPSTFTPSSALCQGSAICSAFQLFPN